MQKNHQSTINRLEKDLINNNKKHKSEVSKLKKKFAVSEYRRKTIEEKLKILFTNGQIKKLYKGTKSTWTEEDIAKSVTLYAASAKAYKLMYKRKFPLPHIRTLQRWAEKVNVSRGLIKPVIKILKASSEIDQSKRICVLSFDEMKIRKSFCYDKSSDTTIAPASYVQVAMLRGIIKILSATVNKKMYKLSRIVEQMETTYLL